MAEQSSLSRELAENELPEHATESLEEAQPGHRRHVVPGQPAGGSEEKSGAEGRPSKVPTPESRPTLKPPPLQPRK
jgi:hypothetical protein